MESYGIGTFSLSIILLSFIQVVACNNTFIFEGEQYSMVCLNHSLYNLLPVEGYLGWNQFLTIINKIDVNFSIVAFVWTCFYNSEIKDWEYIAGLYDVYLVISETSKLFSRVIVPFYILTSKIWVIQTLYILTNIWCCYCFLL